MVAGRRMVRTPWEMNDTTLVPVIPLGRRLGSWLVNRLNSLLVPVVYVLCWMVNGRLGRNRMTFGGCLLRGGTAPVWWLNWTRVRIEKLTNGLGRVPVLAPTSVTLRLVLALKLLLKRRRRWRLCSKVNLKFLPYARMTPNTTRVPFAPKVWGRMASTRYLLRLTIMLLT